MICGLQSVKTIATFAAFVGMLTVSMCMVYAPLLFREINSIRYDLNEEMNIFRVRNLQLNSLFKLLNHSILQSESEEIWSRIQEISKSNRIIRKRESDPANDAPSHPDTKIETTGTSGDKSSDEPRKASASAKCNCAERKCPAGPRGAKVHNLLRNFKLLIIKVQFRDPLVCFLELND